MRRNGSSQSVAWAFAVTGLGLLLPGCAGGAGGPSRLLDEGADGRSITVAKGQRIALTLPAEPNEGSVWSVTDYDPAVLREVESSAVNRKRRQRFAFEGRAAGTTDLTLRYGNPWEGGGAGRRSFTLNVTIER